MEDRPRQKKFAVTSRTPPYSPSERRSPRFRVERQNSALAHSPSESHRLFITPKAARQIFTYIGWGSRTEKNVVEQGGIILGQVFRDATENLTYGVVEAVAPGNLARGSSAHLEMTHETWKEMLDSVDNMLSEDPDQDLQVIGWYHTHPNDLSVFMSGTDQATQRRLFSHDWQFAIVMNPHKMHWKAFFGSNSTECRGFILYENTEASDASNTASVNEIIDESGTQYAHEQSQIPGPVPQGNRVRAAYRAFDAGMTQPRTQKWLLVAWAILTLLLIGVALGCFLPHLL